MVDSKKKMILQIAMGIVSAAFRFEVKCIKHNVMVAHPYK